MPHTPGRIIAGRWVPGWRVASVLAGEPAPVSAETKVAKRTRGPNKPKAAPVEIEAAPEDDPAGDALAVLDMLEDEPEVGEE